MARKKRFAPECLYWLLDTLGSYVIVRPQKQAKVPFSKQIKQTFHWCMVLLGLDYLGDPENLESEGSKMSKYLENWLYILHITIKNVILIHLQ